MFSMIPLYAQSGYGMTATETGALVTPRSIAMVSVSMLAALLLPYTGYRKPIIIRMLGTAAALFVISLGIEEPSIAGVQILNFVWLAFIVCCTGIAFGMLNPSLNNAALDLAPDRIPAIVGLRAMFMSLGGTVGISIILLVVSRSGSTAAGLETAFTRHGDHTPGVRGLGLRDSRDGTQTAGSPYTGHRPAGRRMRDAVPVRLGDRSRQGM